MRDKMANFCLYFENNRKGPMLRRILINTYSMKQPDPYYYFEAIKMTSQA